MKWLKKIWGYMKTLYQYIQTPKGNHDFFDYLQFFFLIGLISVALFMVIKWICGS